MSIRTLKETFLFMDNRTQSIIRGSGAQASLSKREDTEIRIKPLCKEWLVSSAKDPKN
jgi:hypothetical protein